MPSNQALVVDDSLADQTHLKTILQDAGWMVTTAATGEQALEKARSLKPNIIFMDIIMPQLDGYGATRALRSDPETKEIPVVFVSTKNTKADQVWAKTQGGKALIGKPFASEQIIDALQFAV